jgi:hypothetical protein
MTNTASGHGLASDREGSAAAKDDEAVLEQFAKSALRLADGGHSLDVDVRNHVEVVVEQLQEGVGEIGEGLVDLGCSFVQGLDAHRQSPIE